MVNVLILNTNGDILEKEISSVDSDNILEYANNNLLTGNDNISILGKWEEDDGFIIFYGWITGKKTNNTDLPPPLEDNVFYGDILVVKEIDSDLVDFKKIDYINFYNLQYGNFSEDITESLSEYSNDIISDNDDIDDNSLSELTEKLDNLSSDELQLDDYDTDEFSD